MPEVQACSSDQEKERLRSVDIIWNVTRICPWSCEKCCVDAEEVRAEGGTVVIRTERLRVREELPRDPSQGSIYEQAARFRQAKGLELDLEGKIRVLDNLAGFDVKLDFSGGDPLVLRETVDVMREARSRGYRLTVTATGPGFSKTDPDLLAEMVEQVNFTYDGEPPDQDPNCPPTYARSNLLQAQKLVRAGVDTRAELPLSMQNIHASQLERVFVDLHAAGIHELLVMRMFPVGRCEDRVEQVPTRQQYVEAIARLRAFQQQYGSPIVKLQCALKHLAGTALGDNPCDAIRESFGLMWDGTLLGSPWAISRIGKPIHPSWVLGNLQEQTLEAILSSDRLRTLAGRLDESYGHCKIHAFLRSHAANAEDRIFDRADPLYSGSETQIGRAS